MIFRRVVRISREATEHYNPAYAMRTKTSTLFVNIELRNLKKKTKNITKLPFAPQCCLRSIFRFISKHSRVVQLLLFLSVLEMKTTDFGKVVIKGDNANAFIAVNSQGALYTTVRVLKNIYKLWDVVIRQPSPCNMKL